MSNIRLHPKVLQAIQHDIDVCRYNSATTVDAVLNNIPVPGDTVIIQPSHEVVSDYRHIAGKEGTIVSTQVVLDYDLNNVPHRTNIVCQVKVGTITYTVHAGSLVPTNLI